MDTNFSYFSIVKLTTTSSSPETLQDLEATEVPMSYLLAEIVFLSLMGIIGIPGNLLIIAVQAKNNSKTGTDYLVTSMAVMDVLNSSVLVFLRILYDIPNIWKVIVSDELCKFYFCIAYMIPLASAWFLAAIAVDRYIKTCQPLNNNYTTATAKRICVGITSVSCLWGIPPALSYTLDDKYECIILEKYDHLMNVTAILGLITIIIEFGIFIFFYTKIGLSLRQRYRNKILVNLRNSKKNENSQSVTKDGFVNKFRNRKTVPRFSSKDNIVSTSLNGNTPSNLDIQTMNCPDRGKSCATVETSPTIFDATRKWTLAERTVNRTTLIVFLLTVAYIVIWTIVAVRTAAKHQGVLIGVVYDKIMQVFPVLNCITNPIFFFSLSSKFRAEAMRLISCRGNDAVFVSRH